MTVTVVRYSEHPELWEQLTGLSEEIWPEYNLHGDVTGPQWPQLYQRFPDYQFVLYDTDTNDVLAEGQTIPCQWDGDDNTLGPGIDHTMTEGIALHQRQQQPDTLCALAAEIPLRNRDKRLATVILTAMADIGRAAGLQHLIAPVRPSWKERYPINPIDDYAHWTRADGTAFDPWIRVHLQLGARIGPAIPKSLHIAGTVADWEKWTDRLYPSSGDYVFPGGLAPLHVDVEADAAEYWEPNVWLIHSLA